VRLGCYEGTQRPELEFLSGSLCSHFNQLVEEYETNWKGNAWPNNTMTSGVMHCIGDRYYDFGEYKDLLKLS